jgi:hypothetical protein
MKFGAEENFRLRLKEVDMEVENEDQKFIVFKRKRSGSYVPIYEKKSRRMKKEKEIKECYFDMLPDELCLRIFYFMNAKDICQGPCQVSWRLHNLSQNNILWKDLFSQELRTEQTQTPPKTSNKTNWKSYYIKLYKKTKLSTIIPH